MTNILLTAMIAVMAAAPLIDPTGGVAERENEFVIPKTTPKVEISEDASIDEIRKFISTMDIPVLDIHLKDGEFPSFEVVTKPDPSLTGITITGNSYVEGSMEIRRGKELLYESGEYVAKKSGLRVKARGNSSTAYNPEVPGLKIKLSKKADLFFRENEGGKWQPNRADKEWVLISSRCNHMRHIIGPVVGRHCGMEWEPEAQHVCLIVNDRYLGAYILMESVASGQHKVDIDDSGYIMENDLYWWKPDEVHFKTAHSANVLGWTFKVPDPDELGETTLHDIEWLIRSVEKDLYAGKDVSDKIDYLSFVNWILAHDILRTLDCWGSNIFVVKRDFDEFSPFSTKLEMGPLWDFDSSAYDETEKFSEVHYTSAFWYPQLFKIPEFQKLYKERWNEVREDLYETVDNALKKYLTENPDVWKAKVLDKKMGLLGYMLPYGNYSDITEWLYERIGQLNYLINGAREYPSIKKTSIADIDGNSESEQDCDVESGQNRGSQGSELKYDIFGNRVKATSPGIKISTSGKTLK